MIIDVMKAAHFKIAEGSEYGWDCFGDKDEVYSLDFSETLGSFDTNSASVVFNRRTGQVFEVTAYDKSDNCFRWIDPQYVSVVKTEFETRNLDFKVAYDNNQFVDVHDETTILEILEILILNPDASEYLAPYLEEEDSIITIKMTDSELALISRAAHLKNMTLNQFMIEAVQHSITNK